MKVWIFWNTQHKAEWRINKILKFWHIFFSNFLLTLKKVFDMKNSYKIDCNCFPMVEAGPIFSKGTLFLTRCGLMIFGKALLVAKDLLVKIRHNC